MTALLSQLVQRPDPTPSDEGARGADSCLREWLETDGRGGFACSSVTMCPSRRYHGLLVAPPPGSAKRHVFLASFLEQASAGSDQVALSALRGAGDEGPDWPDAMRSFGLVPWPCATFDVGAFEIRREILMPGGRPAVLVRYSVGQRDLVDSPAADEVVLSLRPLLAFREADKLTIENDVLRREVEQADEGIRCRPYESLPPMTLTLDTGEERTWTFHPDPHWFKGIELASDLDRGYEGHEDRFSPGRFEVRLRAGASVTLGATIDGKVDRPAAVWDAAAEARRADLPAVADLRSRSAVAADDFLYETAEGRRGVLAGFPWFGEWGRDTFIALPGLTLARGRLEQCADVLSGARPYLRDGLLPNIFGAGVADSHYGSVDASLWFARAVLLYQRAGGSEQRVLDEYRPALVEIAESYRDGTAKGILALGIRADDDMLLLAGGPDLNPTWMDAMASVGAVTPRDGCAVEIAALWYSLLAHLAELSRLAGAAAEHASWKAAAARARKAFLVRFWLEEPGILADVWRPEGLDATVRPNMVLAASLELSPLTLEKRRRILERAEADLLTPFGLRTLAPYDESYVAHYRGGPDERDRAYHQGTVWPWLLGFYCEASLRVDRTKRNRTRLRGLWSAFEDELGRGGLEHIAEVYDAELPHRRGGTFAQAWNTAELLRAFALIDGTLPLRGGGKP